MCSLLASKGPQMAENDTTEDTQTTDAARDSERGRVRVPLTTIMDCRREAAKVYRLARGGKLDVSDASKLSHMLVNLHRMVESSDLAARVEALESRTKGGKA
jgi:hypothetical protein